MFSGRKNKIKKRVFCIGINKTGTSSLMRCFEILGFQPVARPAVLADSKAREKVNRFYEDRNYKRMLKVAKHYQSFNDRPWNMWEMYRHLDKQFPDSRFVLTVRDAETWWRSVEQWVLVRHPHKLKRYQQHLELTDFNRDSAIDSYHRYNENVIAYFKGTDKLLVMDLEKGDGWKRLCGFLGLPVPDVDFPHANRQEQGGGSGMIVRRRNNEIRCQACGQVIFPEKLSRGRKKNKKPLRVRLENRMVSIFKKSYAGKLARADNSEKRLAALQKRYPQLTLDNFAVVSCLFNPTGSRRRVENFKVFLEGMKKAGVHCLVVELAFGDDPFSVDFHDNVMRFRSNDVLWHKERLLNIGIEKLLAEKYEKIAWLDGDIVFQTPDWPWFVAARLETDNLCQVFDTVATQRRGNADPDLGISAVKYYKERQTLFPQPPAIVPGLPPRLVMGGRTGYGWAARAEVFRKVLLFEKAIVGGADKLMFAAGLTARPEIDRLESLTFSSRVCENCGFRNRSEAYTACFLDWARRWSEAVDGKVGYAPLHIRDLYHGSRSDRGYRNRKEILFRNQYDPDTDIVTDDSECLSWGSNKKALHSDVAAYFLSRRE